MTKIRSILRLYTRVSKKTISEKAGATRNTVKKYIRHYIAMNIPLEELDQMSDTELEHLFSIKEQNEPQKRMNDLLDIFPEIEKDLKRKGVTRKGCGENILKHILMAIVRLSSATTIINGQSM